MYQKEHHARHIELLLRLLCCCHYTVRVIAAADNMPQTKTVKHSATTIVCFCQMRVTETLLWPMAQNCHRCLQGTRQDEVLSTLYNERGPCPNHLSLQGVHTAFCGGREELRSSKLGKRVRYQSEVATSTTSNA